MALLCLSSLPDGALRFAYRDVAMRRSDKGREQDAVSFAYRDVGKGREQDAVSFSGLHFIIR